MKQEIRQEIIYTLRLKDTHHSSVTSEKNNSQQLDWSLNDISCQFRDMCNYISKLIFANNCETNDKEFKIKVEKEVHDHFQANSSDIHNAAKYVFKKYTDKKADFSLIKQPTKIKHPIHFIQPRYYVSKWNFMSFDKYTIVLFNIKHHGLIKLFVFNSPTNHLTTYKRYDGITYNQGILIKEHQKWYFQIYADDVHTYFPIGKRKIQRVIGMDLSKPFTIKCFDGKDVKTFGNESTELKIKKYNRRFSELRAKNTKASRRKLRNLKSKEKRWMNDLIHCLIKEMITYYSEGSLFVISNNYVFSNSDSLTKRQYAWALSKIMQDLVHKSNRSSCRVTLVKHDNDKKNNYDCKFLHVVGKEKLQHNDL